MVSSPPELCVVSYQYIGGTQSYGPSFSPEAPSCGLLLYSAEEMKGPEKSAAAKPASASDSCEAVGLLSLHWKLKTAGWLRRIWPSDCAVSW